MPHPHRPLRRKCLFCNYEFLPDPRLGKRQTSCGSDGCRKKRKNSAQQTWRKKNPDYFQGRYPNTKRWREEHPGYQKQWRTARRQQADRREIQDTIRDEIQDAIMPKSSIKSFSFTFPLEILQCEIQDAILLKRQSNPGVWVAQAG